VGVCAYDYYATIGTDYLAMGRLSITWVSLSNQYRLNLISDLNKSKGFLIKESTYQMSLDDFSEEE